MKLKVEELQGLSMEELREKAEGLKKELMKLRFQAKTGKLEQQGELRRTRRNIARILTIMNGKSSEVKS